MSLAYDINENHNIGVSFKVLLDNNSPTILSNSVTKTSGLEKLSHFRETGKGDLDTYQASLNYNWTIDEKGSNLSFVTDYIRNNADNNRLSETLYSGLVDSTGYQRYHTHTPLNLFKAETHLQLGLSPHSQLEVGGDYYYQNIDQSMLYENKVGNDWLKDENQSDYFSYKGYGFGLYVEYALSLKRWTILPSLRLQSDQIETHPFKENLNKRSFWNLFPGLLVSYPVTDWLKIDAQYKKGMDDIKYGLMNPKITFTSDNTYTKGNPDLDPGTWNLINLNSQWLGKWTLAYNLLLMKGGVRTVTLMDEHHPNVTYLMPMNISKIRTHAIAAGYTTSVCQWWYVNMLATYRWGHTEYDAFKHSSSRFSYSIYNSFEFGKGFSGNLSLNGETKERFEEESYLPVLYTGVGLNKTFLKEKLNVGFNLSNFIVKRRQIEMIKDDGSLRTMMWNKYYAPNLSISISYNINTGKKQKIRRVQTIQEVQDTKIGQR